MRRGFSLALLFLCACHLPPSAEERPLRVSWQSDVAPLPLNDYVDLDFRFPHDEVVALSFSADMPAHRHGMLTRPEVEALGDGRWRVHGVLFHMPGDWVMTLRATLRDGQERVSQIPLTIGP